MTDLTYQEAFLIVGLTFFAVVSLAAAFAQLKRR
jgi:hypothetical protein